MNYIYTKEWEERILELSEKGCKQGYLDSPEAIELTNLIEETDYSNDRRVIKVLQFIFSKCDLYIDETFFGTLSSMDYKIYYEVYFQNVHKLININEDSRYKTVDLLEWTMRDLTSEEISRILPFVNKYINHDDMKILMETLIEWEYEGEDSIQGKILDIIKQTLKEAGKL